MLLLDKVDASWNPFFFPSFGEKETFHPLINETPTDRVGSGWSQKLRISYGISSMSNRPPNTWASL